MKKFICSIFVLAMLSITAVQAQHAHVYHQLIAGTIIGGNSPICNMAPAGTLTCSLPSGGDSIYTYLWETRVNNGVWNATSNTSLIYNIGSTLNDTTDFRVKVTTASCGFVYSNPVTIVVAPPFAWTGGSTITGNAAICYNTDAGTYTAPTVTGGSPGTTTAWWLATSTDSTLFTNVSAGPTYPAGVLTSTIWLKTISTNPLCGTLTSTIKKVKVYQNFTWATNDIVTGGNTPICANTNGGTLTAPAVTGGGPVTNVQWQLATIADSTLFTNILGGTNPNYPTGSLASTTWYRAIWTNQLCGTLTTAVKKITVYAPFAWTGGSTITGASGPLCDSTDAGSYTAPTVTGGAPGTVTQWQRATMADSTLFTNVGVGSTFVAGILTGTPNGTIWLKVIQSNPQCGTLTSTIKKVTVYPKLVPGAVSALKNTCYNTAPAPFIELAPATGGNGNYAYLWEEWNGSWGPAPGINNTKNYQAPVLTQDKDYRRMVNSCSQTKKSIPQ